MRNCPAWHVLLRRHGAALLLALLTAGASAVCAGVLPSWEVHRPAGVKRSSLAFRLVLDHPGPGTQTLKGPDGTPRILSSTVVVSQNDITKVEVLEVPKWREDRPAQFVINLYFKPDAAHRVHQVTLDNMGHLMAIVIDGRIIMAPRINGPIDSTAMIEGNYSTRAEATRVAEQLAP
jgi:preprotein translocase subunit SecD